MRKEKTLFILGIIVAIMPFLGFPNTIRKIFFVLIGLFISYISYLSYTQIKNRISKQENRMQSFVDNVAEGE